jgi:multiple sugar transport system permease protein
MSMKRALNQAILMAVLVLLAACTLFPFVMTLLMSQKTNAEIHSRFWSLPGALRPEYYQDALTFIGRYILNSVLIGATAVSLTVFISSLSGYVFARLEFGGKRTLFVMILGVMMIPGILTLIPSFLWYKEFPLVGGNDWLGQGETGRGFLNTWWVLVIPAVTGGQVLGIFLCRTFFEQIPLSLFEAARIDGASEFQAYRMIAMPLSLPILATLAILGFVGQYNDYIWPLLTISDSPKQVFAVGVTKFGMEGNLDYGPVMAGYVIGSIPLVIVFATGMRYYIEGLTKGGLKA